MFKNLIAQFASHPRKLFLFDSTGGFLSGIVPLLILWNFNSDFGLPPTLLIAMAITGFSYCACSFLCAMKIKLRWNFFLKILIVANSIYLLSLMAYTAVYFSELSSFGLIYLMIDHVVLLAVIILEVAALAAIPKMWIPGTRS